MKREEFSLARGFVAFGVAVALVCDAVSGWNQRQFLREAAPANAAPEQDSGQLEEPLLVLVNGENAVPESWWFLPYLVDDEVVDRRMAEDLSALLEAAESQGVWLWVASGYRSRRRQEDILESAIQERMAQGLSREQARAKALETIAQPGHSEHETGLALDFNDVSQGFQETEAYQWLRQHGAAYGFIQRYQRGKGGRHRDKSGALALPLCGERARPGDGAAGAVPGGVRPLAKSLGRPLKKHGAVLPNRPRMRYNRPYCTAAVFGGRIEKPRFPLGSWNKERVAHGRSENKVRAQPHGLYARGQPAHGAVRVSGGQVPGGQVRPAH